MVLVDAEDPVAVLAAQVGIVLVEEGCPGEEGSRQHQLAVGVHRLVVGILPGRRTGLGTDDPVHLVAVEDKEHPVLAALEGLLVGPVAAVDFRIDEAAAVVAAVLGDLVVRAAVLGGLVVRVAVLGGPVVRAAVLGGLVVRAAVLGGLVVRDTVPADQVVRDTLVVGLQDNLVAEDEQLELVEECIVRTWNTQGFQLKWRRGYFRTCFPKYSLLVPKDL